MKEKDLPKFVEDLYKEYLKRPADKTGLYYFVSMIKNKKMLLDNA